MSSQTTDLTLSASLVGPTPYRRRAVRNANEIVAEHIRAMVFEGRLKAGDRVPQDEIAETLGLSRLPVREALIGLKHQGLVTIHPHRGAYINRFDPDVVRDHFDVIGHLMRYSTTLATERADEEVLSAVDDLAAALALADKPEEVERLSTLLFRTVTLASGSGHTRLILRTISRIVPGNFFAVIPGAIPPARRTGTELASAMRRRDAAEAGAILERYVRSRAQLVIDHLKAIGVFV